MIYVASSWKNIYQKSVIVLLRTVGFEVYDFKNKNSFHWNDVDPNYEQWTNEQFNNILKNNALTKIGFEADFNAMKASDTFVLVNPCGRSAHLELGWAIGQGKKTIIYNPVKLDKFDLMYKMVDNITNNMFDLLGILGVED